MAKIVMPPAALDSRSDDVDLPVHLLPRLAPFTQLKDAPSLDRYPGSCKLRFFARAKRCAPLANLVGRHFAS